MREGQPSATARHVAAYRLGFERLPAPFGDPAADDRLAGAVAAGAAVEQSARMARYLQARTAFFDRAVINALDRGNTQIAAIGAGYDGRALRYAKPGVRWFEVDHPATQRDKRRLLKELAITTPDVTFVAADLVHDDAAAALVDAGFAPDAPTLLLCEGVIAYLEPAVVARLLAGLRSLATAGTRLAISSGIPGVDQARRASFTARVAGMGEPLQLGGADVGALLTEARWRSAELSERAQRAGLKIGVPIWEPGVPPTAARVGTYLERTFHRAGIDALAGHLTDTYGVAATGTRPLDVGVVRVDRADGPPWIARVFPAERPLETAREDAGILQYLAAADFPAERLATADAVSQHDGQAVLVTELVDGNAARPTVASHRQLGELLGRLHTLPDPPSRPGGGWHHLTFAGGPDAEIAALRELLDARLPHDHRPEMKELRAEVDQLDDLHDLPAAFTHPDLVPANAIAAPGTAEPVIIDWAGAGLAPRLWTLGFLLWSAGRSGPRHVEAVMQGYREHIDLGEAELARLEPAIAARPLVMGTWACVTGRRSLTDVVADLAAVHTAAREIAARASAQNGGSSSSSAGGGRGSSRR